MQRTPAMRVLVPALLVAISALSGCGKSEAPPPAQTPEVGIVTLEAQTVTLNTELPGRTNAFRIAEVRPQVNGIILKRLFKEGSDVKAGQQLYQIDPATYEADYQSAQANLASTQEQAQRYKLLVADQAVSKQQYADANAAYLQSKAAVEQARINLRYTKVLSPISGRIGRSAVTEGALVTNGQANAMATVQQLDPIYVDVTQPSTALLRLRRELASGQLERAGDNAAKVSLKLEDGSQYPLEGRLEFSEVSVDEGTGSVTIRAVFPNPNQRAAARHVRSRAVAGRRQAEGHPRSAARRDPRPQGPGYRAGGERAEQGRAAGDQGRPGDRRQVAGYRRPERRRQDHYRRPAVRAAGCRGEDRAGEECRVRAEGRRRSGENRQQGLIKGIRNVEVFH